jgi:hypothetical protein
MLSRRFGEEQVFMDLGMEPGVDFVEQINDAVGSCRLLLAVIGPGWSTIKDAHGRRRLDDPADFIRVEVEAGLRQPDVRVVPVLVQGAKMPSAEELPPSLSDLTRRNALELSDARWRYDVDRLTSTIERVLGVRARPSGVAKRLDVGKEPGKRSWFRRHSRLALAAAALAVLVAVAAVVLASGGGDDEGPEERLLAAIPDSVQEAGCKAAEDPWMTRGDYDAELQYTCRLPSSVKAAGGQDINYGLFPSVDSARYLVTEDFDYEVNENEEVKSTSCGEEAERQMEQDYPGGDGRCYTNADGLVMNWRYSDSTVAAQLYFEPGTSPDAAVAARRKLL